MPPTQATLTSWNVLSCSAKQHKNKHHRKEVLTSSCLPCLGFICFWFLYIYIYIYIILYIYLCCIYILHICVIYICVRVIYIYVTYIYISYLYICVCIINIYIYMRVHVLWHCPCCTSHPLDIGSPACKPCPSMAAQCLDGVVRIHGKPLQLEEVSYRISFPSNLNQQIDHRLIGGCNGLFKTS